jgi:hypothetical protein
MKTVSKNGKGKTLYIRLSVFPCGYADPTKNLTISCSDKDTRLKQRFPITALENSGSKS